MHQKFKLISIYVLLICISLSFKNTIKIEEYKFYNTIKAYNCFEKKKWKAYYNLYQIENNLNFVLNKINYPNFFNYDNDEKYIKKTCVILVNPRYYIEQDEILTNYSIVEVPHIERNYEMILEQETYTAYQKLYALSKKMNLSLYIYSAYRDYKQQTIIYQNGNKNYCAKPGHSEHQTGFAIDVSNLHDGLTTNFETSKEFAFLSSYAHEYGFILRYPKNKETITGYLYEPWHYRYVGEKIAKEIKALNITLEEYIYYHTIINM